MENTLTLTGMLKLFKQMHYGKAKSGLLHTTKNHIYIK